MPIVATDVHWAFESLSASGSRVHCVRHQLGFVSAGGVVSNNQRSALCISCEKTSYVVAHTPKRSVSSRRSGGGCYFTK